MFLDKINESKKTNLSDFTNLKGRKFYFSKVTPIITILLNVFALILGLVISFPVKHNDLYCITIPMSFVYIYYILKAIGIYNFKNPIFIINNEDLFYSKTSQWYKLNNFDIEEVIISRNYIFSSIQMREKSGNIIFTENKWYLKNTSEIHEELKKVYLRRIVRIRNEK